MPEGAAEVVRRTAVGRKRLIIEAGRVNSMTTSTASTTIRMTVGRNAAAPAAAGRQCFAWASVMLALTAPGRAARSTVMDSMPKP